MYDFSNFFQAVADNGAVILALVMALVTFIGKMGVAGKAQLACSLILGLFFGGAFQIAALGLPADFASWFAVVVYGLIMGLTASGVYETGKGIVAKVFTPQG